MATLGTKLLNIRRHHRLSQTEISDILDVSQNAYNKWEADKCKPSADNLFKLSQYYKIDIIKLIDDNEKINLSGIETPPSTPLMERMLQMQEQISTLLKSHSRLMEELLQKNGSVVKADHP